MSIRSAQLTTTLSGFKIQTDINKLYAYNLVKTSADFLLFTNNVDITYISAAANQNIITNTIYYNSNFTIQDYVSGFNWSKTIDNPSISSDNIYLNKLNTYNEYTPLLVSEYNNLKTAKISAYYNDIYLNCSCMVDNNIVIPEFITSTIYVPVSINQLNLYPYIYFTNNPEFKDYLLYTFIDNKIQEFPDLYSQVELVGASNNKSYLKFTYTGSTEIKKSKKRKTASISYTINNCSAYFNKNNNDKIGFNIILYPMFCQIDNTIKLLSSNTYNYFTEYISSNIITNNFEKTEIDYTKLNLKNNIFYIDIDENITKSTDLTSSNYYKLDFDIYIISSLVSNKNIITNYISSYTISGIRLNNYSINLNKEFNLPVYKYNNEILTTKYNINLNTELIEDKGNNDIFDFNITDKNNISNLSIEFSNISSITTSVILNISTILPTIKLDTKYNGAITLSTNIWEITNPLTTVFYNTISESNLLFDNYTTNDVHGYISTNFIEIFSPYTNTLSTVISTLSFTPVFSKNYTAITSNNYIFTHDIKYVGNYINLLNNKTLAIYRSQNNDENKFISSMMLPQFDKAMENFENTHTILTAFTENDISKLSSLISIVTGNYLSSYYNSDTSTLMLNTYDIFKDISKNNVFYNFYYNFYADTYLKIPTYFIGSYNTNYFINNISASIKNNTLNFEPIDNLDQLTSIIITDDLSTITKYNIKTYNYDKNQYLIIDNLDSYNISGLYYKLLSSSICIDSNYNIITQDFTYDSTLNRLLTNDEISTKILGGRIYNTNNINILSTFIGYDIYTEYIPSAKLNLYKEKLSSYIYDTKYINSSSVLVDYITSGISQLSELSTDIITNIPSLSSPQIFNLNGYCLYSINKNIYNFDTIADKSYLNDENIIHAGISGLKIIISSNYTNCNYIIDKVLAPPVNAKEYTEIYQTTNYHDYINIEKNYLKQIYIPDKESISSLYCQYIPNTYTSILTSNLIYTYLSADYLLINQLVSSNYVYKFNTKTLFHIPITSMYTTLDNLINNIPSTTFEISGYYIKHELNKNNLIISSNTYIPYAKNLDIYFKLSGNSMYFAIYRLYI